MSRDDIARQRPLHLDITRALTTGWDGGPCHAASMPALCAWMATHRDDWQTAFPAFASYPHDPFDYVAEDDLRTCSLSIVNLVYAAGDRGDYVSALKALEQLGYRTAIAWTPLSQNTWLAALAKPVKRALRIVHGSPAPAAASNAGLHHDEGTELRSKSAAVRRMVNRLSRHLMLQKLRLHVNLRDMQRICVRKPIAVVATDLPRSVAPAVAS